MSQRDAFKIGDTEYPIPTAFTLGDGPLIYAVTGLEFDEWAERIDDLDENPKDLRAVTGLIAVAVAREKPNWGRDRIHRFVSDIDITSLGQVVNGGGDAGPPAAPVASPSPGSSTESTISAEDTSGVPV